MSEVPTSTLTIKDRASPLQKKIHAHYIQNAIQIEAGHLNRLCETAASHRLAVVLGCIERAYDRDGKIL